MQPLSDPPTERELAQFLDPDGAGHGVRLEVTGSETTAHPTGQFGRVVVLFLVFVFVTIGVVAGVQAVDSWRANDRAEAVAILGGTVGLAVPALWAMVRLLRWMDRFLLVHGPFGRWDPAAGVIELPRLGVMLHRDQLVGVVCLTGGEWWGGRVRTGAWCPLMDGLPDGAVRHGNGWVQINELSVIAQADDGLLARYPVVTVQNPWRFREFAGRFAADFGLPLHRVSLTGAKQRELRRAGWAHAGEFADADRPRKVAAGRVAVCAGIPFFEPVTLCRPAAAAQPVTPAAPQG